MGLIEWLNGKKTYIAALAAFGVVVLDAIGKWANDQPVDYQLLFEALIALAMIFLRKGVQKNLAFISTMGVKNGL